MANYRSVIQFCRASQVRRFQVAGARRSDTGCSNDHHHRWLTSPPFRAPRHCRNHVYISPAEHRPPEQLSIKRLTPRVVEVQLLTGTHWLLTHAVKQADTV